MSTRTRREQALYQRAYHRTVSHEVVGALQRMDAKIRAFNEDWEADRG